MLKEPITRNTVTSAMRQATDAREDYLRARGWKHTCETPGSYWLWEKRIDERTFLMNEEAAFSIQARIDSDEEPEPEDIDPRRDCDD